MYKVTKAIVAGSILALTGCATLDTRSINKEVGQPTQLVVTMNGIDNNKGSLLVFIHDNEHSYYSDDNIDSSEITFFRKLSIPAGVPSKQVVFNDIPAGKYAITAFHDEDNDGRLDRMIFPFFGMPSESYGSSNDSFAYFSKGAFKDALVEIDLTGSDVTINLSTHLNKIAGD